MEAGDVARERFLNYLNRKLKDEWMDTTVWEFYSFLLDEAKKHKPDYSGFGSFEYQDDVAEAKKMSAQKSEPPSTVHLPERHKRKPLRF